MSVDDHNILRPDGSSEFVTSSRSRTLREAFVNAIAHRDWTRYEEFEVVRYADRLEVLSPGALLPSRHAPL